jgi:hypothetical protein
MRVTKGAKPDTIPIVDDIEEPTDVGPQAIVLQLCVPCSGTGSLRMSFERSVVTMRPCVACGGAGTRAVRLEGGDRRGRPPPEREG